MARRFFAACDLSGDSVELSGNEAHHLQRVMRLQPGDTVWLFDGHGSEVLAEITACQGERVSLAIRERGTAAPRTQQGITIATGVPKGDRFKWLIEKVTELGVGRIIPLITQRSIVDPGQGKLDKLRQGIVEACKQCGRSQLMELSEPMSWNACLRDVVPLHNTWLAHPGGVSTTDCFRAHGALSKQLFLIGPEGGFTDAEVAQAEAAGVRRVSLGSQILRIETAALAIAACAAWLGVHDTDTDSDFATG